MTKIEKIKKKRNAEKAFRKALEESVMERLSGKVSDNSIVSNKELIALCKQYNVELGLLFEEVLTKSKF